MRKSGTRAHPRLRGADMTMKINVINTEGSSPLTRGGPILSGDMRAKAGLIPAYAGRTQQKDS